MAAQIAGVFEQGLQAKINGSKILVVGAGGIGCEILKNLVLCGFSDIEIIDLDTIDVSNLNRQFLFHKEHVGQSKAEVARQSALSFNPNVKIKAYHDSIFSTDYGVSFYQKFGAVLNALDNRAARNHVNRMCLTSNVPLIESGTAGYSGQVELIKKGLSPCYECTPKEAQKTYPGCTIRNTPSEPIHCIVWAKNLFNQLFGEYDPDEEVSPDTADPETAGDAGTAALDAEANGDGNVERVSTRKWAQNNDYDPEKVFNKLFHNDINYLLSMKNLWKTRTAPQPVKWGVYEAPADTAGAIGATPAVTISRDQQVWTLRECADVLASSIGAIKADFAALSPGDHLVWDKDDRHPMDFVVACSNIRSYVFGIQPKSRFEVKSMAGNIIPAIATTNAITAGIVVMRAFRVLQAEYEKCQAVYVRLRLNGRNQLFAPDKKLEPPNVDCIVCSDKPSILLKIDTGKVTVKSLRDDILIKSLNMLNPDVTEESKGIILISSEEGETDCNNDKLLRDLGIVDGSILTADDFFQNYNLTITLIHREATREDAELFEVIADAGVLKPQAEAKTVEQTSANVTADATTVAPKNGVAAAADEAIVADRPSDASDVEVAAKKLKLDNSTIIEEDDDDDDLCIIENDDVDVVVGKSSSNDTDGAGPSSSSSSSSSSTSSSSSSSSGTDATAAVGGSTSAVIKSPPKKRKTASDEPAAGSSSKRAKVESDSDDDLILIEDDFSV